MNKLILDGVEYDLSDELIEKIRAEVIAQDKTKNSFERNINGRYYFIDAAGGVVDFIDTNYGADNAFYSAGNYCRDKEMMEQRALHETLNRLLWRYSIVHDGKIENYGSNTLFQIDYNTSAHTFVIAWTNTRITEGVVYFKTEKTAKKAIEEVIKPFLENHPEFDYFNW